MPTWSVGIRRLGIGTVALTGRNASREAAVEEMVEQSRRYANLSSDEISPLAIVDIDATQIESRDLLDDKVTAADAKARILSALAGQLERSERGKSSAIESRADPTHPPTPRFSWRSTDSFLSAWSRIQEWIERNTGQILEPHGASEGEIQSAHAIGGNWPEDLIVYFGVLATSTVDLYPGLDLLPLRRSLDVHAMMIDIAHEFRSSHPQLTEELDPRVSSARPAGTPAGTYLTEFVPLADRDGQTLFVDTRASDLNGCLTMYTGEDADDAGPLWPSIRSMFAALADSLETSTPFANEWQPTLTEERLTWRRIKR